MQILVQHIKTVLPGLKSRISAALVSVAKEHASYGEITESKVSSVILLNFICIYLSYGGLVVTLQQKVLISGFFLVDFLFLIQRSFLLSYVNIIMYSS